MSSAKYEAIILFLNVKSYISRIKGNTLNILLNYKTGRQINSISKILY